MCGANLGTTDVLTAQVLGLRSGDGTPHLSQSILITHRFTDAVPECEVTWLGPNQPFNNKRSLTLYPVLVSEPAKNTARIKCAHFSRCNPTLVGITLRAVNKKACCYPCAAVVAASCPECIV